MMSTAAVWLECPVCEYRFSVPPDYADKTGKCPKCENIFEASDCQLPEKVLTEDQDEPPIPLPAVLADVADEIKSEQSTPSINVGGAVGDGDDKTYVTADKSHTDPNKVLIWVAASCLLAIGLLIGIPALASMFVDRDDEPENKSNQVANQNPSKNKTSGNKKGASGKGAKNNKGGKRKKSKKKAAKPDKSIKNFSAEEYRELWTKCYSGIALVNAKFGTQNRMSHGVVIANDGRIAVSLSNVAGADSVRVRFAQGEYGTKDRWSKPIVATTIMSSKPELDLAIIKVNSKTNPVPIRAQPIKFNDRGVIPTLSNANSDEFFRLTKLRPAKPFDDLEEGEQAAIKNMSLNPATNDYFGVHSAKLNKSGVGAPIFDEQGQLVGMHLTHHAESRKSFLIPPVVIRKVLNDPLARPKPIKAGPSGNAVAKSPAKKKAGNSQGTTFETALKVMSELNWKLFAPAAYQSAKQFSERWWEVNAEYLTADFTRKNKIEELKKQMAEEMSNNLFWPSEKDAQSVNTSAVQAFRNKERGWFAAVTVVKPAGLAKDVDGEPAVLVKLDKTNEHALLIPGEVEGPFLPGAQWLIFGINKDNTRLNTADGKCMVIHLAGVKKK